MHNEWNKEKEFLNTKQIKGIVLIIILVILIIIIIIQQNNKGQNKE